MLPIKKGCVGRRVVCHACNGLSKRLLGLKMRCSDTVRPLKSRRSGPLRGTAAVPGDKSISHRALILGALTVGETRITGLLEAEDVLNTAEAMRAFGARVVRVGAGEWTVHGTGVGGW